MPADIMITIKLILLLIIFIFIVQWAKDTTGSKILAILIGLIMTYLVFSHEEIAIIAIVLFFVLPHIIMPALKGAGLNLID